MNFPELIAVKPAPDCRRLWHGGGTGYARRQGLRLPPQGTGWLPLSGVAHRSPNGALSGVISWSDMKAMARGSESANMQARTFQITATEVGGQDRIATVDGTVRQGQWLVANIKGPNVTCQGNNVPWFAAAPNGGGWYSSTE